MNYSKICHAVILLLILFPTNGAFSETSGKAVTISPVLETLRDMRGNIHHVHSNNGKNANTVLVFWQTWCTTCRAELPSITKVSEFNNSGLQFFGIISGPDTIVNEQKVNSMVEQLNLSFPQIRDKSAEISDLFEVVGTPTIIIFNSRGEILYRDHTAPGNWNDFSYGAN